MNNKRGYFKRTLSLMLSLLLVLGTFCFFNPFKESVEVAEAATAGSYSWKVTLSVYDNYDWKHNAMNIYVDYFPDNGTSNVLTNNNNSYFYVTENQFEHDGYSCSFTGTSAGYPARVRLSEMQNKNKTYNANYNCILYVYNNNTKSYVEIANSGNVEGITKNSYLKNLDAFTTSNGTYTKNSTFPYVASISLGQGTTDLTVPGSGSETATTGSATVSDQYGVQWYLEPEGYKIYSNDSSTGDANKITATGVSVESTDAGDKGTFTIDNNFASWVSNGGNNTSRYVYVKAYKDSVYSNAVAVNVTNRQVKYNFYNYNLSTKKWDTLESKYVYYNYPTKSGETNPTRTGWVFQGYNTNSGASSGTKAPITVQILKDTSWYAIFTKKLNSNWYWFDASGNKKSENRGTTLLTTVPTYTASAPDVPTTVSYGGSSDWQFVGWREDANAAAPTEVNRTFDENASNGDTKNYYAIYQRTFTLKLDGNGSGNVVTKTATQYLNASGNIQTFSYDLSNFNDSIANTTFVGWSTNSAAEYTNATNAKVTLSKDTTYYAIYKVGVNFYNEGELYNSQTITRGKNATNPAPNTTGEDGFARPQKEFDKEYEYYYTGWDKSLNNITENTDINATYESVLHTYVTTETYATPTCTENGSKAVKCGNIRKDTGEYCYHVIDPLNENLNNITDVDAYGHSWVITPAKEPTCTTDGYTMQKQCSRCTVYAVDDEGNEIKQTVVPALGHDIDFEHDTPIEVFEHNCVSDGYKIYKCKRDGCTYTEKVITDKADSTLHNEVEIPAVEVTCTTNGSTAGIICSVCGAIIEQPRTIICEGHKWDVVKAKAATCTEDGCTEGKKCSVCGLVISTSEVIPATGHTLKTIEAKDATCTEAGNTAGEVCSVCGEIPEGSTYSVIPALGHEYLTEPVIVKEATCSETGLQRISCQRCGGGEVKEEVIPKLPHTEEEIAAVEATCSSYGYTSGTKCSVCGEIIVAPEKIAKLEHDWVVTDEGKDPTADEEGRTIAYECSVCHKTKGGNPIPAKGHSYGTVSENPATCESVGTRYLRCGDCGDTKTEIIEALGHNPVAVEAVAPTCVKNGNTAGTKCSRCGEILSGCATIPATGNHTYGEDITEDATCTTEGRVYHVCTECGTVEEISVIPAKGHTEEEIAAVEATCSSYGYTSGTMCSVCGEIIVAPEKIDKLEHTWEVVEEGYPATCTTDGKTTSFKCSVCGATKGGNVLNKSGHSYGTYAEIAATCEGPGKQFKRCGNCGATTVTESNPLGHNYKEVAAVAATCTTAGTTAGVVCSRCGDIQSGCEVIEATGHKWVEKTVEATCTTDGKVYMVCSVCGAEGETIKTIPAHHTEEAVAEVKATCTRSGYKAGTKCSVCGEILSGCERTEPAAHTVIVYQSAIDATCNTTGWTEGTKCGVCGLIIKKSTVVARLAHTYTSWTTVAAADCVSGGRMERECTMCGATETMTLLPKGHSYSGYATLYEPTCTETGCKQRICKNCGEIEDVAIEAKGHVKKAVSEVAATCTADGHTAGVKCSTCGITLEGIETLPATGHTWEKTSSVEGDCEHDSYDVYTCATCGETENRITKYCTGHESETAPTCKQRCVCDICGQEYGDYGDHNYEAVTTAPTCTKEGYTTYTCTYCGDTYTALPTAATGVHTYVEVSVEKEATCTEDGTKVLMCKTCGATVTETIPAKGHNVTEWTVDGSNCSGTCAECGEVVTRPATDSDYTVCDRCGLKHTRSTGLFKYKGVFCSIRYFFRQIAKLFKK